MNIALMSMNIALMMCMLTDCLKDVKKKVSKCRLDSEKSLSLKLDKIDPYGNQYIVYIYMLLFSGVLKYNLLSKRVLL